MSSLTSPAPAVKPTTKPRAPRPRPARRVRLIIAPTPTMPGIVRIEVETDGYWTDYNVTRLPSQFGTAFRLVKILGPHDRYDMLLNGERSSCECRGFLRHGHCKHRDGLQALVNAGKL